MRTIMTIAILLFSGIVLGKGSDQVFDVKFNREGKAEYSIQLNKDKEDKIAIRILNADRTATIYTEVIKDTQYYKKRYDFSQLKNDTYIISVSNGNYVFDKTITKSEEGISEDFGAFISDGKSGHVEVRLTENASLIKKIRIKNERGITVYEHTDLNDKAYDFNLLALDRGTYKVEVISNEMTVSKYYHKI